jgi:hypothetical protein
MRHALLLALFGLWLVSVCGFADRCRGCHREIRAAPGCRRYLAFAALAGGARLIGSFDSAGPGRLIGISAGCAGGDRGMARCAAGG